MIRDAILLVGKYAYYFVFAIAIVSLLHQPRVLSLFLGGLAVNVFVNVIVKTTLREKRPHSIDHVAPTDLMYYGMPSLHAQNAGYCLAFLLYTRISRFWYSVCCLLAVLTILQRYWIEVHTPAQLGVGLLLGLGIGAMARRIRLDTP
jgi:membrane-associated phospholipid phosphatase